MGSGSEDAGSKGKGVEQDHSEQPWVWFCSHRQDMDEPRMAFLDVFLSPYSLSSVFSLGLLFSDVSLTREVCPAVMEGTAARAEHPGTGTSPAAMRCAGASRAGSLRTRFSPAQPGRSGWPPLQPWLQHLCPVGGVKGNVSAKYQSDGCCSLDDVLVAQSKWFDSRDGKIIICAQLISETQVEGRKVFCLGKGARVLAILGPASEKLNLKQPRGKTLPAPHLAPHVPTILGGSQSRCQASLCSAYMQSSSPHAQGS